MPSQNKKFSAEYDWIEDDPTLPVGWKSAIINMNSFGKIVESTRFLSPDGRFCTSRVEAIKYMMKDGSANVDDMNRMKMGLMKVCYKIQEVLYFLLYANSPSRPSFFSPLRVTYTRTNVKI